jgi:DNA polymerase-3 subunit epsilon
MFSLFKKKRSQHARAVETVTIEQTDAAAAVPQEVPAAPVSAAPDFWDVDVATFGSAEATLDYYETDAQALDVSATVASRATESTGGFAIIDFETTGLSHGRHDRIVEVAVVHTDRHGTVTGAWETLVNPGRDVGPTHIHRIRASDILAAPTFEQIAPRLVELLSGRVIVAHNASFDTGFLLSELSRLGYETDARIKSSTLCTMQLARQYIPESRRSLSACCDSYGIPMVDAHRASVDALATAHLLAAYMTDSDDADYWNGLVDAASQLDWPPLAVVDASWIAREQADAAPTPFLERITMKLPDHSGPAEHTDYLALLDRCLLDQQLSAHEADALVALAEDLGISRVTCEELHRRYFDDVVALAWADDQLTPSEIATLVAVGTLLLVSESVISAAMQKPESIERMTTPAYAGTLQLEQGDRIVLTGDMSKPREEWEALLTERGFVVWPTVTKKVKLVVAADPDSLSGKARKARDYGITIVGESALVGLIERDAVVPL